MELSIYQQFEKAFWTLYDQFKDAQEWNHNILINDINGSISISDYNYAFTLFNDTFSVGITTPGVKSVYCLTNDQGLHYVSKYNVKTKKTTEITFNTFKNHFRKMVKSFNYSLNEPIKRTAEVFGLK